MRKQIKQVVLILLGCVALCGCYPKGYVMINDYSKRMELVRENFPEIYDMYCNGLIKITEVYTYPSKTGGERIHIEYEHIR